MSKDLELEFLWFVRGFYGRLGLEGGGRVGDVADGSLGCYFVGSRCF